MQYSNIRYAAISMLLAASLATTSCASIVNGANQKFTVQSEPARANLTVDGMTAGQTPARIALTRKENHVVKLDLAGYQPVTIPLERTVSGWLFGNIIFGGIIGIVVDAVDGSMYKLTPKQINTYANSAGIQYKAKNNTMMVILAKNVNKHWEKIGTLKKPVHSL